MWIYRMKQTPNLLKTKHALHLLGIWRLTQAVVQHNSNTSCAYGDKSLDVSPWEVRHSKKGHKLAFTAYTSNTNLCSLGFSWRWQKKCRRNKFRAVNTDLVLVKWSQLKAKFYNQREDFDQWRELFPASSYRSWSINRVMMICMSLNKLQNFHR